MMQKLSLIILLCTFFPVVLANNGINVISGINSKEGIKALFENSAKQNPSLPNDPIKEFLSDEVSSSAPEPLSGNLVTCSGLIFEKESQYRLKDSSYTDIMQLIGLSDIAQAIQFRIQVNKTEDDSTILIFESIEKGSDISNQNWVINYNVIKGTFLPNGASKDEVLVLPYNLNQNGGLQPGDYNDLLRINYIVADLPVLQDSVKSSMRITNALASTAASEEKEGLFNGLLQRQVIVPVGRKGYGERIRETSSFSIPIQTLVLHLTEACNLGCAYCYHSHKSKRTKKKEWMTSQVAEKAVNFLFASSGNLKEVVLVFFGREPLLNFDLLASVVSYSRKKAAEEGKSIAFALTTNGTLLTPAIISFLNANRIGITISIDGDESLHDRCRPFRNGKPSYQIIVSNLKELLQGAPKVPTVARVTVTKTLAPVSDILDHLLTLGFAEVVFGPVTTNDLDYQLDAKGMEFLLGQFRILSQKFLS